MNFVAVIGIIESVKKERKQTLLSIKVEKNETETDNNQ
jgi:hypothetical protein